MDPWTGDLQVAVRWREEPKPDALAEAELEVLRRYVAELMREVRRLQEANEPPE